MKRLILLFAALLCAPAALGQLSGELREWGEGPVRWLMTQEDRSTWNSLGVDEYAREFIELFWARRDPTPGTDANEWKEAFEKRVEAADKQFGDSRMRGSLSDRGRVFILLGSPYRRTVQQETSVGGSEARASLELWHYERGSKPPFAEGPDFEIEFMDTWGRGEYVLVMSGRRSPRALLDRAVEYYIFQPGAGAAPAGPMPWDRDSGIDGAALRESAQSLSEGEFSGVGLAVAYDQAVTPAGDYYVPMQLFVSDAEVLGNMDELRFVGLVENAEGEIIASYDEPADLKRTGDGAYFDRSLRVRPGVYLGTFGLARGEIVAVGTTFLELSEQDPEVARISELTLSRDVHVLQYAQSPTEPFAWGGMKIVPEGDLEFAPGDEIWYFVIARIPGIEIGATPQLNVQLTIEGETATGQPVRMAAPVMRDMAQPIRDTPDHFLIGSSLPAGTLQPGNYRLGMEIVNVSDGTQWNAARRFTVR
ncbi:MAG: GWxTD domain-containing protein [Acidobacteria bacterium]|nr:GWxTD domain-containing protein [Acidobacteriota bacterium]